MSSAELDQTRTENIAEFYKQYEQDQLSKLGQEYPQRRHFTIDYGDLWTYDTTLAEDYHNEPDMMQPYLEEAVSLVDLPNGVVVDDVTVRVVGVHDELCYMPGELRSEHAGDYIGITGVLERVTTSSDFPHTATFRCQNCLREYEIQQDPTEKELQYPAECVVEGAQNHKGPYKVVAEDSDWSDYAKLRVEARPDVGEGGEGKISGFVLDDLIEVGGGAGLIGRAGEPVTVYGIVRRQQKTGRNENELLFDHFLEVNGIEFDRDEETVDIAEHKEEFTRLSQQPDAVDLFADSIAPQIHATDAWEAAFQFSVAYLFGAPRVDLPLGPTYRGDLHFLMITDFAMGKSTLKGEIELYSPKCIAKSTTALSSGVGLTAAAVKDDFGAGQWTLKPGLLVRANNGHLILDEIDKGPEELTDMNDALEGEQVVDIEKAGMSATYESRTGLMALGNPEDGRFNQMDSTAEQMGIDQTLLSRFDGIVTMKDKADEEQDKKIAETWLQAYTESQEVQYSDRKELDQLERPVPVNVGRAWIKYARENVNPILTSEHWDELMNWYAEDIRPLNETLGTDNGEGSDMPVSATTRDLAAAAKMAMAFARCQLEPVVQDQDIERAKNLGEELVSQRWRDGEFVEPRAGGSMSKNQVRNRLLDYLDNNGGEKKPENEIATEAEVPQDKARTVLKDLAGGKRAQVTTDGHNAENQTMWRIL